MASPLAGLVAQARRRPILIVGAAAAGLAGYTLLQGRNSAGAVDAAAVDPTAVDPLADPAATATDPAYQSPYTGGSGGFDPFGGGDGGGGPDPLPIDLAPGGCILPKPAPPAGYDGQGDWSCDAGSHTWVWTWSKPDTTPGGCPLPKPVPEPAQAGFGSYVCNPVTHKWHWKPSTPPPGHRPPPTHTVAHGELSVTAGAHRSWHRASGNGPATDARDFTHAGAAVQFLTGPSELVKLPNGTAVHLARVRHAPGHPAIAGRYMRAGPPAWRWRKAT